MYEDYKVVNTEVSDLLTVSPNNSLSSFDLLIKLKQSE
ncbi:prophage L54a, portal, HK97 family domain protein [Staphylococcus aureus]|nr:prophage L54a, portal, HK97 family domain protein [Staphylococcus aureus]